MASLKYRYAHQQERKALAPSVEAGEWLCMQTDPLNVGSPPGSGCVMKNRWIAPGQPWQLAHDESGLVVIGPAHRRCNARDGAVRGNKRRAKKRRRLIL